MLHPKEPTDAEIIERKGLSRQSAGARNEKANRRLSYLELKHEGWARQRMAETVEKEQAPFVIDDFNYEKRRRQGEQAADVHLPSPDQLQPGTAHQLLQTLGTQRITANALTRQAERRSRILDERLARSMSTWKAMTVNTVEWQAEASAADIFKPLTQEVARAKAHASFCNRCLESVRNTIRELHWIMDNWDRFNP